MNHSPAKAKRVCISKKRYATEQDALDFANGQQVSGNKSFAYKCECCPCWHLSTDYGHPSTKKRRREEERLGKIREKQRERRLKKKKHRTRK